MESKAAKVAFRLNPHQMDVMMHHWYQVMKVRGLLDRVALCLPTFLPLYIEREAIASFLSQSPQYRNALPEVLSPQEAVLLADMDYRLTPQEKLSLGRVLKSPLSLQDWLTVAEAGALN